MDKIWREKNKTNKISIDILKDNLNNLKTEKNNIISNNYSNISFSNNKEKEFLKRNHPTIIIPEEDNLNNLINQNINSNNIYNLPISPFNMINLLNLTSSLSTKTESNYSDSNLNSFLKYNEKKIITPTQSHIPSNLYYTNYGFNNNINNNINKNYKSNNKTPNNKIRFNFSKSELIKNNLINYNLINNSSNNNENNINNKDNLKYLIDINNILNGKEKRTSIMIKNIPIKYSIDDFIKEINIKMGFDDIKNYKTYDWIYLPISNNNNNKNLGYAFINFINPLCIIEFYNKFTGLKWKNNNGHKECQITYAKYQGKEELNQHLLKIFGDIKKASIFNINFNNITIKIQKKYKNNISNINEEIKNKIQFI